VVRLGQVAGLQVQEVSLKLPSAVGAVHPQRYDPAGLVRVAALRVSEGGVVGVRDSGELVLDVHHREHPLTKNVAGKNGVSVGFSAHYAAMRARFGAHLVDGIAGENVLVACEWPVTLEELAGGLLIRTRQGAEVRLARVLVAEPCVPFSRFSLGLGPADASGEHVTAALQFLRAGRRGFYATCADSGAEVRVGDAVFALEARGNDPDERRA
jgi:hypothetical protein